MGEAREEAMRRDCCGVICCCCSGCCCCVLCMAKAWRRGGVKLPRSLQKFTSEPRFSFTTKPQKKHLMGEDSKRTLASDCRRWGFVRGFSSV